MPPQLAGCPERSTRTKSWTNGRSFNAAKYGALSTSAGRLQISWGFEPDVEGTLRLVLRWEERGGPKVVPATTKGFGHVVIERVVGQALSAHVGYEFPPEGVRWSIALPLDFVVRWRSQGTQAEPVAG